MNGKAKNLDVKQSRLSYIDCIRGAAIVAVVLGHTSQGDNFLRNWLYSFHLPVFFILSGILLEKFPSWEAKPVLDIVKKKAASLLYPYFMFSIIVLLYYIAAGKYAMAVVSVLRTIGMEGESALWFLPALLLAESFFFLFYKRKGNKLLIMIFLCVVTSCNGYLCNMDIPIKEYWAVQFFFSLLNLLNRALIGTIFIMMGYMGHKIIRTKLHNINKYAINITGILLLFINLFVSQYNPGVDLHFSKLNNPLLFYFNAVSGSLFLIIFMKYIVKKNRALEYLGRNSLIIMATHTTLPVLLIAMRMFQFTSISCAWYIEDIIICFLTICMEVIMIAVINRWMPFLVKLTIKLPGGG